MKILILYGSPVKKLVNAYEITTDKAALQQDVTNLINYLKETVADVDISCDCIIKSLIGDCKLATEKEFDTIYLINSESLPSVLPKGIEDLITAELTVLVEPKGKSVIKMDSNCRMLKVKEVS